MELLMEWLVESINEIKWNGINLIEQWAGYGRPREWMKTKEWNEFVWFHFSRSSVINEMEWIGLNLGGLRALLRHGNQPKEKTSPLHELMKLKTKEELSLFSSPWAAVSLMKSNWWSGEKKNKPTTRPQGAQCSAVSLSSTPTQLSFWRSWVEWRERGCWVVCLLFVGGYGLRQQP